MIVDIFSSSLWLVGGGDQVTAAAVRALLKSNHDVVLHTARPVDVNAYSSMFGADLSAIQLRIHSCPLSPLKSAKVLGRYARLACEFSVRTPIRGDVFVDLTPATCLGATYFRLPDIAYWNPPDDFRLYLRRLLGSPLRRALFTPFAAALTALLDRMNDVPQHFVNSKYSEKVARENYGGRLRSKLELLYPPVDLTSWTPQNEPEHRSGVISVARFSPWKRQDMQLQIVGNRTHLEMVGGARAAGELATLKEIRQLKPANVQTFPNLAINELKASLWRSKVFLHTADNEPFGLSIVQAIAAGCVPIIRRCGGASEVVPYEELTFENPVEGRSLVEGALRGDFDHYMPRLREYIRRFDESVFSAKFLTAVTRAFR